MRHTLRRVASFLGVMGLAALLGLPVLQAWADNTPRFNQMAGDEEFLRGRNVTQNQTSFTDPVSANDGDVVEVKLWYHNNASNENGDPGTAAQNVRVKVQLPAGEATSHIVRGSIEADNAPRVTDTVVDGTRVGQENLTVNTPLPTTMQFIPGSVRWHPDGSTTPVVLPGGQTGDEIIAGGVNLGDILGCWQFVGAITFQVRLEGAGAPSLVREKSAFNETQNRNAIEVPAKAGDRITYTLKTRNVGTRPQEQYVVTDDIRDILQYANLVSQSDNGRLENGFIIYPAADIPVGQELRRTFTVQIKAENEWPTTGDFVLTNVYGNQVDVPIQPPVGKPGVSIDKTVKLITGGEYVNEVETTPGQQVSFRIVVKNTGAVTLTGITLLDTLRDGLEYVPGTTVVDMLGRQYAVTDEIVKATGLKLNDALPVGQSATITFTAKVPAGAAHGSRLTNVATVRTDQTTERQDEAYVKVVVAVAGPVTPTPVTPGPQLPTTGAADLSVYLLGLAAGGATSVRYWRAKRSLMRAANGISVR